MCKKRVYLRRPITRMVPASSACIPASVTESLHHAPACKTCGAAMTFPIGHYDNNQIDVLEAAMKLACRELCISTTDQESRERVASMMMAFAKYGHIDVEKLKTFAVQQF
jgi:hypothetical protein